MNMFNPAEITKSYSALGIAKVERPLNKMLILAVLAGVLIGMGGVVTNTATHSMTDVSTIRVVCGLLFPFGLGMVMLTGAELFTGNNLISITVLNGETTMAKMLRNWVAVYLGNFVGAAALAAGCAFFGQMNYSSGGLAVATIKTAIGKCALLFPNAIVSGFFCNVLVCLGVFCSLSAKDTVGKILGAFLPVSFFVICGFEHCVANMYYIPAGIFALQVPEYAALAAEAGLDTAALTWGSFLVNNLLPVTIGNIIGGVSVGAVMWKCHMPAKETAKV